MRVIVVSQHGGADVLQPADMPPPQPGPGQLLVDLAAAGVNFMDIYQREGRPPYASNLPYVPGAEGAGTVVAVGPDVTGFAVGDRVAWTGAPGSYAEQVLVPAAAAVSVPGGMDLAAAAAVMLQGMTAHYLCYSTYPVAHGDPVVVHAAAGGVGLLLTQLAKLRGGQVIATTSTDEKAALARKAGADEVIGYDGFAQRVKEISGEGAAAVYDGVGKATFLEGLDALRPFGRMILYGAASGQPDPLEVATLAPKGSLYVQRPTLMTYARTPELLHQRAGEVCALIAEGKLHVRIGARYPLDQATQAHEDLEARRTTGKLLLIP